MATPLFISDEATLLQRLRLTGAVEPDTLAFVSEATRQVRVGFYQELGLVRVAEVVDYASSETPATSDEFMRARAEQGELEWIKLKLVQELPQVFIANGGSIRDRFNEETMTRETSRRSVQEEVERLQASIAEIMAELGGEDEDSSVNAYVIGPEETNEAPGAGIDIDLE